MNTSYYNVNMRHKSMQCNIRNNIERYGDDANDDDAGDDDAYGDDDDDEDDGDVHVRCMMMVMRTCIFASEALASWIRH